MCVFSLDMYITNCKKNGFVLGLDLLRLKVGQKGKIQDNNILKQNSIYFEEGSAS